MQLTDAVALVTGGSAGIGRSTAVALAERGARVLVHGRDPERTMSVAQQLDAPGLLADLGDPDARARLATEALAAHGRVDILINNAGIGWYGPFTEMPAVHRQQLIELNLNAAIDLTSRLLPPMLQRHHGTICFISSVAGGTGVAGEAVYAATKAGLGAFADSLRLETSGTGVRICTVVPGVVDTGFFERRGSAYRRRFPRPIPAEAVARGVVAAISVDQPEVWVPAWLRTATVVRGLMPGVFRTLSARFGEPVRLRTPR